MSLDKNKNINSDRLEKIVAHVGLTVVALATVLNMADTAEHVGRQLVVSLQPNYAAVSTPGSDPTGQSTEFRRGGKEEVRHSSATFGAVKMSHAISGTL